MPTDAESPLARSLAQGGFFEAAADAMMVLDTSGTIVRVNPLTERMFGYRREELMGRAVELLVPEQQAYFDTPPPRRSATARQSFSGRRRDGSQFPVEISLSPYQLEQGSWMISILRDLTQREEADAKFRSLLESAPDAIVVVDARGTISIINSQTEKMFGYRRDELLGRPVEVLIPTSDRVQYRDGYYVDLRCKPMTSGCAAMGLRRDGTEFPVEIRLSPLETEQGTLITGIIRDITDRRIAEERIKSSLREKEAMLKEIHHRVKNNLQITSSLLKLQSGYIHDTGAKEVFATSQSRIRSMALVHEKLYQSTDLSRIDFSEYARSLGVLLFRSFAVDSDRIALKVPVEQVSLSIEVAVPCGLILNELLSNSLKHAFPDNRKGEIEIRVVEVTPSQIMLSIGDNGVGFRSKDQVTGSQTLGLQLVRTLTDQLRGKLEVEHKGKTEFRITFSPEARA